MVTLPFSELEDGLLRLDLRAGGAFTWKKIAFLWSRLMWPRGILPMRNASQLKLRYSLLRRRWLVQLATFSTASLQLQHADLPADVPAYVPADVQPAHVQMADDHDEHEQGGTVAAVMPPPPPPPPPSFEVAGQGVVQLQHAEVPAYVPANVPADVQPANVQPDEAEEADDTAAAAAAAAAIPMTLEQPGTTQMPECPVCLQHTLLATPFVCQSSVVPHAVCSRCLSALVQRLGDATSVRCPLCRAVQSEEWLAKVDRRGSLPLQVLANGAHHLAQLTAVSFASTLGAAAHHRCSDMSSLAAAMQGPLAAYTLADVLQHPLTRALAVELGLEHANGSLYAEHLRQQTSFGLRFATLVCAQAAGFEKLAELQADATGPWLAARGGRGHHWPAKLSEMNAWLQEAQFLTTMPLWLDRCGQERIPQWIAHETMLKPEDANPLAKSPTGAAASIVLSYDEIRTLLLAFDRSESDGESESECRTGSEMDSTYVRLLQTTPIWTMLVKDLHASLQAPAAHVDPELRLAQLMFFTMLCANAANHDLAAALSCSEAVCSQLRGRVVNNHCPTWLQQPANRLMLDSKEGLATTDSIPLCFTTANFDEVKANSLRATAWLLWHFLDINALLLRHVRHPSTPVHNDCASEVKLMLFGYEMGWLARKPLLEDVVSMLASTQKAAHGKGVLTPHPVCHVKFVFWGYTRTASSHQSARAVHPSDTFGRLNSACWVALGWGGCMATGGVMPPGVAGGSAQGKSPTPNDVTVGGSISRAEAANIYAERRELAVAVLRDEQVWLNMQAVGRLRSIHVDWVRITRLQACDFVAVVSLVYRFTAPGMFSFAFTRSRHGGGRMMWHVCGPGDDSLPAWPPDVRQEHEQWLVHVPGVKREYMCDPPVGLWKRGCMPIFPRDPAQAVDLLCWWSRAHVPACVWQLKP